MRAIQRSVVLRSGIRAPPTSSREAASLSTLSVLPPCGGSRVQSGRGCWPLGRRASYPMYFQMADSVCAISCTRRLHGPDCRKEHRRFPRRSTSFSSSTTTLASARKSASAGSSSSTPRDRFFCFAEVSVHEVRSNSGADRPGAVLISCSSIAPGYGDCDDESGRRHRLNKRGQRRPHWHATRNAGFVARQGCVRTPWNIHRKTCWGWL